MKERSRRGQQFVTELAIAGNGAWLVANAYEGLVDVPQLLIDSRECRKPGVLRPGSPVRYFALNGPLALVPTSLALATGWKQGHRAATLAAASTIGAAVALSGYLIRTVNVPLLTSAEQLDSAETSRLKKRWHTVNAIRLAALTVGIIAIKRTRR